VGELLILVSAHPRESGDPAQKIRGFPAYISFKGRLWKVPQAFYGERLAIRPLAIEGQYGVFFASHQIATIDLTTEKGVGDVSEQASVMSPG
jgi:putative transposase